ncbi:MAG TPA: hypothetical protein DD490_15225 [Acidobacteria bacterium]|nr:hypothetical protein [Acidobacteriota bacterium]
MPRGGRDHRPGLLRGGRDTGQACRRAARHRRVVGRPGVKRGEVWWADLPPPVGSRPVIVLTRNAVLHTIGSVVVVLVTRTVRDLPTEVTLGRRQGLPMPCVANFDNILTIPRDRLTRVMGACDAQKVQELDLAIKTALEIR